jgi:hypothetical protein
MKKKVEEEEKEEREGEAGLREGIPFEIQKTYKSQNWKLK